jgi:pimeloyl-ACP methyl ester carboxylesterase
VGTVLANLRAQWNGVVLVATTIEIPVLSRLVDLFATELRLEQVQIAGVPTLVARPSGRGPCPVIVFLNGSTRNGCADTAAAGVVRGLARGGYLTFAPELPGSAEGELSIATADATLAVVREVSELPEARGRRIAVLGVSVGASLALLAAAESDIEERLSFVAGLAPYADLDRIARLATTGRYEGGGEDRAYRVARRVQLVLARSLAAQLPPGSDRDELLAKLRELEDGGDPLALSDNGLGPRGRALVRLLANRDPSRYEELRAELPEEIRAGLERLSPLRVAGRITVPVELASAQIDGYFPAAESRDLAAAGPNVRLTLSSSISHVHLRPSLGAARDLARFDRLLVRALRAAADSEVSR